MTIENKRRELFEAWWREHKGNGQLPARYAGGQYIRDSALCAWIGFNAALDAVAITLPLEDDRGRITRTSAIRAIESTNLGLKVLP